MMGETVEQRGGHLGVAEDGWPFAEGEVGGDDDRGALVEPAHEVEEQLPAGLGEGQIAKFVEDDEVAAYELVRGAALASGAELGLEVVDQVDDVVAAAPGALADAGARDGDGEMGLAGAGAADLSLLLIPSGTEILVFWVLQRLAWLVAPKDVPLMTRRGDLKLSHGATARAERTP